MAGYLRGRFMGRARNFERRTSSKASPVRAWCASRLVKVLGFFKSVLVGGAVLGLVQPAFAAGFELLPAQAQPAFVVPAQGLFAALQDLDRATSGPADTRRDEDAFAALSNFAGTIAAEPKADSRRAAASLRGEQGIIEELEEFARSVGAARSSSNQPPIK